MSDANIAVNFDFSAMLQAHIESGADVTVAYKEEEFADSLKNFRYHEGRLLLYTCT